MSIKNALETIDILIATAPVDHPDAWIPMRLGDMGDIRNALRRAARLETGLLQIIGDLQASVLHANGNPPPQVGPTEPEEADDYAVLSDNDWCQLATAELGRNYAGYLTALAAGTLTWRKLEDETQTTLLLWMIWVLYRKHDGNITGPIWDRHRPDGVIRAAGMYNRKPFGEWVELALAQHAGPESAGDDFRDA